MGPAAAMTAELRVAAQLPRLLRQKTPVHRKCCIRYLSIKGNHNRPSHLSNDGRTRHWDSKRCFTSSTQYKAVGEESPSPRNYIENPAVFAEAKNIVGVKKVLVIGSGGLSIGQAGEFDYSGVCVFPLSMIKAKGCLFWLADTHFA